MLFTLTKGNLVRDQYLIYDIIQQNINKRPIYFTGENLPSILGLSPYTRREGSSIRLLPILNPDFGTENYSKFDPPIDNDKTLDYFKNEMEWGNIKSGVYLEETGQRQVMRVLDFASTMVYDYAEAGEKEKALKTYGFIKEHIFSSSVPKDEIYYIFKTTGIIDALLKLDENDEANRLMDQTNDSANRILEYHQSANFRLPNSRAIRTEMIRVLATNTDNYLLLGNDEKAYETAKPIIDWTVDTLQEELNKTEKQRDNYLVEEVVSILESIQNSASEYENDEISSYIENALER